MYIEPEYCEIDESVAARTQALPRGWWADRRRRYYRGADLGVERRCRGQCARLAGDWQNAFIYPPYAFKAVDTLVTNFHLPRSSLLLLVSAFVGRERLLAAYREAIERGYRFYSYGDAMMIV